MKKYINKRYNKKIMQKYQFQLNIPPDQVERIYSYKIRRIQVETRQGLLLEFPAIKLIKFVTDHGIHGSFEMTVYEDGSDIKRES